MSILERYRAIRELSRQMAALAHDERWDAIIELQAQREKQIAALNASGQSSAEDSAQIRALICEIQGCDERVRSYLHPKHQQLATLTSKLSPTDLGAP